ncbi:uncharacterized RING finger protein T02C1.1-like [Teleopsis dalmanni]|uniref:uncharacterized RING finger protein T02C1.1-like n=1 Tax=Teleopsis dalmanni TaxID=139649 RepID=UPI000D32AE0B|nr:uncharacterized RING finger protein T02C1.1-like [Teleopsis dalmanni]
MISTEHCTICLGEKIFPTHLACGHSYCRQCLQEYKNYANRNLLEKRCPICGYKFSNPRCVIQAHASQWTE